MLRKHYSEFLSDAVQHVLGQPDYVAEQVSVFRRRVEAVSEMIVRPFTIDRTKTEREMITALGRKEYLEDDVLEMMPIDGENEGDLYFFSAKRYISAGELAHEFEIRGLVPHALAQMQVNIDDPSFGDDHPNGMQWGKNCYATFYRGSGGRGVDVARDDDGWDGLWWFAGVRKPTTL